MSSSPESPAAAQLPSGLVAFVKRDCPTCELVEDVLEEIAAESKLTVYTQDDPKFPSRLHPEDDTDLTVSWHHQIEAVPTLLRVENGVEVERVFGWHRGEWEGLSGVNGLGEGLPDQRPGCGSLSVDPIRGPELRVRFEGGCLRSRRVEVAAMEDEQEMMFRSGWSDGYPLVPPTEARVMEMLTGTKREPDDVVAIVPPDLVACSIEKVAINAVMAGCKPEYLPVVIAALEATCTDTFNMHGIQATTMGIAPVVVVNGPIRHAISMNSGVAALGPGNRANATIGRALQLLIRNVGGSRPGGIDRSTFGHPGKIGVCFAEAEEESPWEPLCTDYGIEKGANAVTVYAGEGMRLAVDQLSREPESLIRSLAACLRAVHHPKLAVAMSAMLIVGPEHGRVLSAAGWSKGEVLERLHAELQIPGREITRGFMGISEGLPLPEAMAETPLPKFRPGNLHLVFAGSGAGLFSTIIGGWLTGPEGSQIVSKEID